MGSQYTSSKFDDYLNEHNIVHSFSGKGCPYDNACIESFHATLKKEEVNLATYYDFDAARLAIFEYIESWYNRKRLHNTKNESLCELKKQAETYPNALQKSLVNFFMFEAGFSLMFVKANSGTDDKYYIAGHVFRIVSCLNQVLFACNNAYCINEKKAIKLLETFEHKPEKYTEKVNHIFEVLGISLFECYDMTEKLYNEVNEIVSEINNFLNEENSDERKQI